MSLRCNLVLIIAYQTAVDTLSVDITVDHPDTRQFVGEVDELPLPVKPAFFDGDDTFVKGVQKIYP